MFKEFTKADQLQSEVMRIHHIFKVHPELLQGDKSSKKVYDRLMTVHSVEDMKDWLRMMSTSNRAKNLPKDGAVVWEDVLGRAERIALQMDEKELRLAVNSISRFIDNNYSDTFSDDLRSLLHQREQILNGDKDIIAIFQHGDNWFAFANDADSIFEKMGWQTSLKLTDEGAVSWMDIGYSGMAMLNADKINIRRLQPEVEIVPQNWSSEDDYNAVRLSLAQQTIDYLRHQNHNQEAIVNIGTFPVYTYDEGVCADVKISFVRFSKSDVDLITEKGRTINLVSGHQWNVADGMKYIIGTGDMLDARLEDVSQMLLTYDSMMMQQQLRTNDVMEEYTSFADKYRYDYVLMEQDDFYEALGDDAVALAEKYHLMLWDRDAGNGQMVPMVMLNMNQLDSVLSISDDVLIEESRIRESKDKITLKPCPLNEGLTESLHFNKSGIKKTRNGEFVVWARINGVDLPEEGVASDMGIRYSRLSGGAEKELVLRTVLQQTYGAVLSMPVEHGKAATVKI